MTYNIILKTLLITFFTTYGIAQEKTKEPTAVTTNTTIDNKAAKLIEETIAAHGGVLYETASYAFTFRERNYTFTNTPNGAYTYTVSSRKKGKQQTDSLENGAFKRFVNKEEISLSSKEQNKHSEALNSVIYFTTLPHKLRDKAVIKSYLGTQTIKGKEYHVVGITFREEGGGKDYKDAFHYWIHTETKKIDYLAYMYHVNGGGVRYRSAYNTRVIDGITFQDYINYKAAVGTPLIALPNLYEKEELKELSRIEIENINNLNSKK